MGMMQEFKEFAMKGSVIDLAVGVVIGAAFGKIVASMVDDIIMPLIGLLAGGLNYEDMFVVLANPKGLAHATLKEAKANGVATLNWGLFLTNIINFLIIAFSIFLVVRQVNRMTRKAPAPAK
jgi:large conductance mechanosensitive channel